VSSRLSVYLSSPSLVTASKGVPLHLWDAYSGKIHLSFSAMDAVDELATARAVDFLSCGTKLVAAYEKFVALFSLSRPGRECEYIRKCFPSLSFAIRLLVFLNSLVFICFSQRIFFHKHYLIDESFHSFASPLQTISLRA